VEEPVIRTMIVAEMDLLRGGLRAVLDHESDLEVVADLGYGDDALSVAAQRLPDVVVVDVDTSDADPLGLVRQMRERLPTCSVIVLSGQTTPNVLQRALGAHARGFLGKDRPPAELVQTVRQVAGGELVIDPVAALAAIAAATNPLTAREREVLRAAALGLRSKEIAARTFLAYGTVRNLLSAVVRKTGSRNHWEAIRRAQDAGWL
jgi:two-component system, NarL family, response regulator DesR